MNQFYYTRKEPLKPVEGEEVKELQYQEYQDSLNLDKVIRSIGLEDGQRLVLLDDLHERMKEVPVRNKAGKLTAIKQVKDAFQSEIYLNADDSKRFIETTQIKP